MLSNTHGSSSKIKFLSLFIFGLLISAAPRPLFAGGLSVSESVELQLSPEISWAIVGSYQSMDRWHPVASTSESTGTGKDSGDVRILTLPDGGTVIERLISYNEEQMKFAYAIIYSPLPISNYVSEIKVEGGKKGQNSKVTWSSTFDAAGVSDAEAKKIMKGVYVAGLEHLKKLTR
jgi:mxaD protein